MNEILLRIPPDAPPDYVDDVRALAERLERVVERVDPTRLTAMAVSFNEVEYRVADVTDIFALNLYFGWYHDTFADLGVFLDSLHAAHPDVPLMLSEYGAGSDERDPRRPAGPLRLLDRARRGVPPEPRCGPSSTARG